jgi:hypothetical protein
MPAAGAAGVAVATPVPATTETEPTPAETEKTFGRRGSFAISAERLAMLGAWKTRLKAADGNSQDTYSGTDIALLGMAAGGYAAPNPDFILLRMPSVPRIAFDYFVTDHISVGGFLGYFARSASASHQEKSGTSSGGSSGSGGVTPSMDGPSSTIAFIGARGSFFLPLGAEAKYGFWFRGGLSYVSSSSKLTVSAAGISASTTTSLSEVMVNADALFLLPLTSGFAITGGPFFDGSLTGSMKVEAPSVPSVSNDAGELAYGVTFGLTGYL